jgi:hypothetical protein
MSNAYTNQQTYNNISKWHVLQYTVHFYKLHKHGL